MYNGPHLLKIYVSYCIPETVFFCEYDIIQRERESTTQTSRERERERDGSGDAEDMEATNRLHPWKATDQKNSVSLVWICSPIQRQEEQEEGGIRGRALRSSATAHTHSERRGGERERDRERERELRDGGGCRASPPGGGDLQRHGQQSPHGFPSLQEQSFQRRSCSQKQQQQQPFVQTESVCPHK